ncbi:hypothetical protein PTSG_10537 [Salpingoeca rosetta]|uniref:CDP-diacylglycerol--glycerol-3-phosphate 3-phosphatidyltransferase n=1 Tax=Salpingoeca rosetta (strain ATCC 50818 / BSB-021) TaxID=946362 RepID=F2URM7_SALR5|nr:uncharacterized protein PTSG_10537 [Salpingoeca rosetta]EGD80282.1 hypothetical protein PTSG_10537 [Salpingoeca rosetta]|eukprot:XP_004988072.1 hypothetical protein PTSG_10537 [Salpingoeca rosetta]
MLRWTRRQSQLSKAMISNACSRSSSGSGCGWSSSSLSGCSGHGFAGRWSAAGGLHGSGMSGTRQQKRAAASSSAASRWAVTMTGAGLAVTASAFRRQTRACMLGMRWLGAVVSMNVASPSKTPASTRALSTSASSASGRGDGGSDGVANGGEVTGASSAKMSDSRQHTERGEEPTFAKGAAASGIARALEAHTSLHFDVHGDDIHVETEPAAFYTRLVQSIKTAERRVVLTSLYLGTGQHERDLVSALTQRMEDNTSLETTVVLDYTRGTRGSPNSMGPFGVRQEEECMTALLRSLSSSSHVDMATGYFNLSPANTAALLSSQSSCRVICASPRANGFLGARGPRGHIPAAYTHMLRSFLQSLQPHARVEAMEYEREGWTFHAKGMWVRDSTSAAPSVTIVGSSNFGQRSSDRDLEAQAVIVTSNPCLQAELDKEVTSLVSRSSRVCASDLESPSRRPNLFQTIGAEVIRSFL